MKRTDRLTTVIAILLFLAFAAYAGSYAYRALSDTTVTAEAVSVSVTVGGTATGVVVREETVLSSSRKYVDVTAADGKLVAGGETIALAMSSETGLERASRIRELEGEISRMETALGGSGTADDLTSRDERLREAVLALAASAARRDTDGADTASLNLRSMLMDGAQGASQAQLSALRTELESLKNSSSSDTTELRAEKSGLFSSILDGYESLSPAELEHLTPAKVRSFTESKQDTPEGAYGKLITEYYWYFACVMSAADAQQLESGSRATLDFGRYYGTAITGRVMSISDAEGGVCAVCFRMDSALAQTLSMREASAEVVFEEYEGIRVPADAVHVDEETGESYVWVITAMQLERKDIDIIYTGDGFCIASRGAAANSLREGNTIVVSGRDLHEGKLME